MSISEQMNKMDDEIKLSDFTIISVQKQVVNGLKYKLSL
jgi:hypothetical protein